MAVPAVAFDGVRISGAESESDGGTWDKYKATQSPTQETDFVLQGTFEISNKVSNTSGGLELEATTSVAYSTGPRVALAKFQLSTPGLIDETVAKGLSYEIGNGTNGGTGTYEYYQYGLYAGSYPLLQNWLILAIDPNEIAWRDAVTGTPALGSIDWYGLYADITAVVKSENLIHSALDYFTVGTGLTVTGGDGAGPAGTLDDIVDWDFGTSTRRYLIASPLPGGTQVGAVINGVITLGTATATVYVDSGRTLVFPEQPASEGFCGIDVGMLNAVNRIDLTSYTLKGLAPAAVKKFFDTALQVNGTTDVITMIAHGLRTGDYAIYNNEGGADNIGLSSGTGYFIRRLTDDTFACYAVGATVGRQNSFSDTTRVNLTAATAPGENHSFLRDVDMRPDHTVSGTTGVSNDWTACSIDGFRILTLTSKSQVLGGFIKNGGSLVLGAGLLSAADISLATLEEGTALIDTSDLADIQDCTLTASDEGHAVEIDTAGLYSYQGNTHTDYGPNRAQFHTITGVDAATEVITTKAVHGFTTGDAVYYDNHGGPDTVGLTSGNKYYVNAVSTTTLTIHATRAAAVAGSSDINLSDGTAGEIHSLYSARASLLNSVSATLVDSYAVSNQDWQTALDNTITAIGQSFTGNGGILSRCRWYLRKGGSPTGNAVAKLYAHTGTFGTNGTPTGSALATSKTLDVSTLETTYALWDFEFDDRVTMTNTTKYFIVVEYSGGDGSNYVDVGIDTASPTHGGNYADFTGTWADDNFNDCIFYVYSGGEVVVNITGGGDTPSYRNSGSPAGVTIINNAVTLKTTFSNDNGDLIQGFRVRYERADGSLIAQGETDASGVFSSSISVQELPLVNARIIGRKLGFEDYEPTLTIPTSGFDIPVTLIADGVVNVA